MLLADTQSSDVLYLLDLLTWSEKVSDGAERDSNVPGGGRHQGKQSLIPSHCPEGAVVWMTPFVCLVGWFWGVLGGFALQ